MQEVLGHTNSPDGRFAPSPNATRPSQTDQNQVRPPPTRERRPSISMESRAEPEGDRVQATSRVCPSRSYVHVRNLIV